MNEDVDEDKDRDEDEVLPFFSFSIPSQMWYAVSGLELAVHDMRCAACGMKSCSDLRELKEKVLLPESPVLTVSEKRVLHSACSSCIVLHP